MAGKKIPTGTPGMYGRIGHKCIGGKPVTTYYGRVYIGGREVVFRLGTGLRASEKKYHAYLGDPEAALREREQRTRPTAKPIAFHGLTEQFRAKYRGKKGSWGDSPYYTAESDVWKVYIGDVPVASITPARVESFRAELEADGYNASSVRKHMTSLSTCLLWAKRQGIIAGNPAEGVHRPAEPDRQVEVLYPDEEQRLLAALDPEDRPRVRLYNESGMRLGGGNGDEGINLAWTQVDRQGGELRISKSKNGKARTIPINDTLAGILDDLGRVRHMRSEYVLCDREGQPLDARGFSRRIESALDRAGIVKQPGALFNLFRHSFGSRLAEKGVPMVVIAALMGNTVAVCERHYLRFSPGHLRAAMARLDADTGAHTGAQDESEAVPGASDSPQIVVA